MNEEKDFAIASTGNVFADMGLEDADELLARSELGYLVRKIIKEQGLNQQKEISELLGIKQPEVSQLMNGKYHLFSEARLMNFLGRLNQKITITITPRNESEKRFIVQFASGI